ncbi:hypothetical protein RchiOBHm_Chr4g0396321 [Rosa chinensis]|uniref:Uncharacterized protein n=1 Tax=Rosa chinensis TaxID=74649 RepID=A0A2P6QRR4_ROSCH|nr:hypothetical protein RchiOBHm_Chr4g0396321 [Rosa chinensis]
MLHLTEIAPLFWSGLSGSCSPRCAFVCYKLMASAMHTKCLRNHTKCLRKCLSDCLCGDLAAFRFLCFY